ncbi:hypothetical protein ABT297_19090 [Dactylosporangium sp. NPDC000555]|uniref:hypothetical protein n=1 Tax=Dactylosporangium sp. NPDC000555 TaxID=3154260 RepID=UPI003317A40C
MNGRRRAAGLTLLILALLLPAATFSAAPARADSPAYNETKTFARKHLNADGTETVADTRTVTVQVSQVERLKARQQIEVKWSGAHPSHGVVDNQNAADALYQEYPVMIMQCRGDERSGTLNPSTCWTQGFDQRKDNYNIPYMFPPWRLDRDATAAQRKQVVGFPDPVPAACPGPIDQVAHYEPFVAEDKTVYRPLTSYDKTDVCGKVLAPDMVNVEDKAAPPGNTTYASTDKDGNGSAKFVIWTGLENASLGCSAKVSCSLVVLPIMGMSCDETYADMPANDRPALGRQSDSAQAACRATGQHEVNEFLPSPIGRYQVDTAVTAANWWSPSIWKHHFSIKLGFGTSANVCDIGDIRLPVELFGSELMQEAIAQWAPAFCSDPSRFKFRQVQMGEPLAKSNLDDGKISAALVSRPPDDGDYGRPVVNAPIAVTGFAISYVMDDKNHNEYKSLKLNPRLIAKLLSESYPGRPDLTALFKDEDKLPADHPYRAMANNPTFVSVDPEFKALNPDVGDSLYEALSASALIALSGNSDVMWALTAYLNADPDARAFLNGEADPWGMVVNPGYKGIELPQEFWPLLDTFTDPSFTPYSTCGLPEEFIKQFPMQPYGPLLASPVTTMMQTVDRLQFGQSNARIRCAVFYDTSNTPVSANLSPYGRQRRGDRFVLGITSLAQAQYYQLNTAALQTTSTVGKSAKFTDTTGRTFAGPGDASLKAAMRLAKPDATANAWVMPYDTMRTPAGADAYPGTLPVYAAVATKDVPGDDPGRLAQLLRFAVGDGQVQGTENGQLPPGYLPLTAANGFGDYVRYTLKAADAVARQQGEVPRVVPETTPGQDGSGGSNNGSNGGSSGSGSGGTTVPNSGSRPSAAPSASASPPAQPVAQPVGTTALLSSVLASWGLPVILLVGLCAGCAGTIMRLITGFNDWRRSL